MFSRKIYSALKAHLKSPHITVLTGMRRTGKTTAIKYLMEELESGNKLYLDFERLDNRDLFSQRNYESIANSLEQAGLNLKEKAYLFLDEIQLVKNTPSVLKYLYDHYKIKFIVTGSSSYYLKNLFSESLSGRKKIFELYPLDFSEFLDFKRVAHKDVDFFDKKFNSFEFERLNGYYEEFINFGGFPEVVLMKKIEDKKDLLFDILDSYIKIDISALSDFRNLDNAQKLLKMLSQRVGTRLDYSKMARLSGMSRETVKNYIDFFEQTYILARVSVFSKNPDREIVKAQKLYFSDNGLLDILSEISSGSKFENAVFNQLRHHGSIQYYATRSGMEIDFVLDGKMAVEIKENPLEQDRKKMERISKIAGIKKCRLVGRAGVKNFDDYIWGGEVR
jgi:predicted AAA+ superfamily ATPase